MKKLILMAALCLIGTFSAFAQSSVAERYYPGQRIDIAPEIRQASQFQAPLLIEDMYAPINLNPKIIRRSFPDRAGEQSVYYLQENYINYVNGQRTVAYDPISNTLLAVFTHNFTGDDGVYHGQIAVARSSNLGMTWDTSFTYVGGTADFFRSPSIAVANPFKTKNFDSLFIFVNAIYALIDMQTSQLNFQGLIALKRFNLGSTVKIFDKATKKESGLSGSIWLGTDVFYAYKNDENGVSCNYLATGHPYFQNDATKRKDLYGLFSYKAMENNATKSSYSNVQTPQWGPENFYSSGTAYTNSPMINCVDDNGKPFVFVNNLGPDEDPQANDNNPAFSYSNDLGQTWTDMEMMPDEALETAAWNYFAGLGEHLHDIWVPFDWKWDISADAAVFNENDLTFAGRYSITYDVDGEVGQSFIIAAIRKLNGVWTLENITQYPDDFGFNAIDPYNNTPENSDRPYFINPTFINRNNYTDEDGSTEIDIDSLMTTSAGHQLQLAKTPEGDLIAKWVDFVPGEYYVLPGGEQTLYSSKDGYYSGNRLDTLPRTDVYMSVRRAGEGLWSTPVRIHGNDSAIFADEHKGSLYPKLGTQIPTMVYSLDSIPLFDVQLRDTAYDVGRASYRPELLELCVDPPAYHFMCYNMVNLRYVSVDENKPVAKTDYVVGDIYPNPAGKSIFVPITAFNGGIAKIAVYNSFGEKLAGVETPSLGTMNAVPIDVSGFSNGVYYCVVELNGQASAKKFTIAR